MSARYFNEVNPDGPLAGTKCPVSPGRLRELYEGGWREEDSKRVWCEPMSLVQIGLLLKCRPHRVSIWLQKCSIEQRPRRLNSKMFNSNPATFEKLRTAGGLYKNTEKRVNALKQNILKANKAWSEIAKNKRVKLECVNTNCKKTFTVPYYKRSRKYCSLECVHASVHKIAGKNQVGKTCYTDIWCPQCLCLTLADKGTSRGRRQFKCVKCNRFTVNPLLEEPTPRQVLERHRELRAQGVTLREVPALEGSR